MALLELRDVSKAFGGLQVIDHLSLHVDQGEIVSVIGPNGAGKTTVFNLITGIFHVDSGEIVFEDNKISGLAPHRITNRGIARTFQTLRLFLNMTVLENVMAAEYGHTKATFLEAMLQLPRSRREEKQIRKLAEEKLAFFGQRLAGYRHDQPAYSLDEPAAGMNPHETHEITELIGKLRDDAGYSILVIEHDMHVVEGISDRVIALDHGIKIAEGLFDEVATHPLVVEAYLGVRAEPEAV
jgi:ABC-type branched-subunit amino acid transport system ATPase component